MKYVQQGLFIMLSSALLLPVMPAAVEISAPFAVRLPLQAVNGTSQNQTADLIPQIQPVWTARIDFDAKNSEDSFLAQTSGETVYYESKGQVVAAKASTGRVKWISKPKPVSNLAVSGATLSYMDDSGKLLRLNSTTGKVIQKIKTGIRSAGGKVEISTAGGRLYVTDKDSVHVYEGKKGRLLWKIPARADVSAPIFQGMYQGVAVVSSATSGAVLSNRYEGYDAGTGRRLWELAGSHGDILTFRNGHLYLRDILPGTERYDGSVTIDKVDAATGKINASLLYRSFAVDRTAIVEQVRIDGDDLYLITSSISSPGHPTGKGVISRFNLDRDPAAQMPPPEYVTEGTYVGGPYLNRVFFAHDRKLETVKFYRKDVSILADFTGPDRKPQRLDLIGSGAYAAQEDGRFYMIDIPSGRTVGQVDTKSRIFGQTLLANGMVIIQAEGRLIAFKRPKTLKD